MTPVADRVVLGMGNLILSDDGAGVHAARRLAADPRLPPGTEVVDAGTFGVELTRYAAGCRTLVVLDAVDVGAEPGTVCRMEAGALAGLAGAATVHDAGLADLLAALRLMGEEPARVVLLGIQPGTTEPGTALSPRVEAAVASLVEAALEEIGPP